MKNYKIIDLSVPIESNINEPLGIKHDYLDHKNGARHFSNLVNKKMKLTDNEKWNENVFPENEFLTRDIITMSTHTGTHIDAPIHYGSLCEGMRAKTVSELPLEWFINEGVKLDFSDYEPPYTITKEMIKDYIENFELKIRPFNIILIETGCSKFWNTERYRDFDVNLSLNALNYLLDQGIKVIGIDTFGFDESFQTMISKFNKTKDNKYLWPNHFFGRQREYIQIERLNNLDLLPKKDFIFNGAPLNIINGEASWIRAIGMIQTQEDYNEDNK